MHQDLWSTLQSEGSLEGAYGREALQVRLVSQGLHTAGPLAEAPARAHGREAVSVSDVRQALLLHLESEDSLSLAQRRPAVRVRQVRLKVHAARSSEAAPAAALAFEQEELVRVERALAVALALTQEHLKLEASAEQLSALDNELRQRWS